MMRRSPFRYFKTSPEIIRLAVMLYIRFLLSFRKGGGLLHENDIDWNQMSAWPRGKMNDINILQVEKVRRRSRFLRHLPHRNCSPRQSRLEFS